MQVHLTTLGCRLNEAELEHWADGFQARGHAITDRPELADLVIVNTCAVTHEAARKSRQIIRRTHRKNPNARLIVSGCYSSLEPDIKYGIEGIDLVVTNRDKDRLVDITEAEFGMDTRQSLAIQPGNIALFKRGRNRAFVKIQDGCRYRCSYCIVTIARGNEKSRQSHEINDEINNLSSKGIREIVLTGVHVGGYGSDINSNLYKLIKSILENTDIKRIRLASVEPWDLHENFFELFQNSRLMPHLHLPLQCGSDSVLRRMQRRCRTSDFKHLVEHVHDSIPDFNISTDIIVGFPGETEQEWKESIEFIEMTKFSGIHVFPFSPREGTRAATLPDQISTPCKKQRSLQLRNIAKKMKSDYMQRFIRRDFPVLWEFETKAVSPGITRYFGYTPNYIRVCVDIPDNQKIENRIINTQLIQLDMNSEMLIGKLI